MYFGHVAEEFRAVCGRCEESYRWTGDRWDLVLSRCPELLVLWAISDQLKVNGRVSYREDLDHNLAVCERPGCQDFGDFFRFVGRVLGVGCGPHSWPARFCDQAFRARFVGVDSLIEDSSTQDLQHRAVVEFLPSLPPVFGHVLFAASSTK
jgi:hypothetical protein